MVFVIHRLFLVAQLWEHKVLETGSLAKDTEEEEEKKRKIAVSRHASRSSLASSNVPSRLQTNVFTVQELSTRPVGIGTQGVKRKAESLGGDSVPSQQVVEEGEMRKSCFGKHTGEGVPASVFSASEKLPCSPPSSRREEEKLKR